ncbi:MAG: protein kinase [Solirubrobacterales bacterium]
MSTGLGPGVIFANHRIEAELGRGGMGVVFKALELTLDRPRALKVVAEDLATDATFKERFRREARLAASVDHPNVIAVHHAGEEAGIPYLSMSLVDGPDLGALVGAAGPLDPARASRLISQIAAGLEAAHARGLVHRDIKPSNVLISEDGGSERVFLTDFGLSRHVDEDGEMTQTGDFLGSTDYVAPEQIEGGPVDARADVYARGALADFLLTGEAPFARRSSAAKLVAHVNAERPRPSAVRSLVPTALDDAVTRAMAVKPAERFSGPAAFADAFDDAVRNSTSDPVTPSSVIGVLVVAAAAAAVAFLLALGGAPERREPPQREPPVRAGRESAAIPVADSPTALTTEAGFTWVAARDSGVVEAIAVGGRAPDPGRRIDLGSEAEPSSVGVGFGSVWIVDRDSLVRAPLADLDALTTISLEGGPKDVVVSPSSVWVALEDSDEVAQIDPATNSVETLPVSDGPRSVAYGDGGVWVACIEAGTVLRIDEQEGRVEGRPIAAGSRPNDLAVGNDGVWVIDNLEGVVRRIDPDTLTADDPIEVGARPRGVVAARNSIWIASFEDGTVGRIQEADRRQVGTPIEIGDGPADISAGGDAIWTANFTDDTVSRIEP